MVPGTDPASRLACNRDIYVACVPVPKDSRHEQQRRKCHVGSYQRPDLDSGHGQQKQRESQRPAAYRRNTYHGADEETNKHKPAALRAARPICRRLAGRRSEKYHERRNQKGASNEDREHVVYGTNIDCGAKRSIDEVSENCPRYSAACQIEQYASIDGAASHVGEQREGLRSKAEN